MVDRQTAYVVAWADGLSGLDANQAYARVYLKKADADAEVKRVADAIKRSRADEGPGAYDQGLTVVEFPIGGEVDTDASFYLTPYLEDPEKGKPHVDKSATKESK